MAGSHFPIHRPGRFAALLLALVVSVARIVHAGDAFVILSGGDSPMENNYSQYLQARAMAASFETAYPPDSVWVFFGAGNVEGEKPFFSDVYHEIKRDGVLVDSWLPGAIPRNHPARHDAFLRALREEILPVVATGGTLYLFVGDHGSRTRGRNSESIISLWGMYPDPDGEHGWSYNENESLSVSELRRTLAAGLGKGRVVFCMTQCHSGGFHYLAVPHQMQPNPAWFTKVPDWAARRDPTAPLPIAGFTATDEYLARLRLRSLARPRTMGGLRALSSRKICSARICSPCSAPTAACGRSPRRTPPPSWPTRPLTNPLQLRSNISNAGPISSKPASPGNRPSSPASNAPSPPINAPWTARRRRSPTRRSRNGRRSSANLSRG